MGRVTALRSRLTKHLHSPWFRRGVVSLALLAAVALWAERAPSRLACFQNLLPFEGVVILRGAAVFPGAAG